jgi:peptide/nickel transport system substrate-binding protein
MISVIALIALLFLLPTRVAYAQPQRGPKTDILRLKTVKSPDAQLFEIQTGGIDELPDLIRPADIETLDDAGMTISASPGFHMGHIGMNIRPDQSYRGSHGAAVDDFLSDIHFRHALFHCYNQDEIVASIYKYIVTPVRSLVPPALGGWVNPAVPKITFDPEAAKQVLLDNGYTYDTGIGNWRNSLGDPCPDISVFTPTYEVAPTSAEHGRRWIDECNNIGLPLVHEPTDFASYLQLVFGEADFDMYMVFWSLGRFPDHLYDMLHSSQDCALYPWRYNAPGVNDALVDANTEVIKFGLDADAQEVAAYEVQYMLYDFTDTARNVAGSYMQLYSRVYFTAFRVGVYGVVNMPGYGADNSWTFANAHWRPNAATYGRDEAGNDVFVYCNGEEPESFNPCYAHTVYAWNIIGNCFDSMLDVNPYTLEDEPALADDWSVDLFSGTTTGSDPGITITDGETVTFYLNDTATWQDGKVFTAEDVAFNFLFMRDNTIPRYTAGWEHIVSVDVVTSGQGGTVKVYLDVTGRFYLYDLSGMSALLHPTVWTPLDGQPLDVILAYDPTGEAGHNGQTPTNLIGTGPYVFDNYDPVGQSADMTANRDYWQTTNEIQQKKVDMFHSVGDIDYDGVVAAGDLNAYGLAFGTEPPSNPDADLNGDGRVDGEDGAVIGAFVGKKREYPDP